MQPIKEIPPPIRQMAGKIKDFPFDRQKKRVSRGLLARSLMGMETESENGPSSETEENTV